MPSSPAPAHPHCSVPLDEQPLLPKPTAPPTPSVRSRYLGGFLVFSASVLWVASGIVAQFIFGASQMQAPFVLTYVGQVARLLVLTPILWRRRWRAAVREGGPSVRAALVCSSFSPLVTWTYYTSVLSTTVASASTLSSTSTMLAVVITALFLRASTTVKLPHVLAAFLTTCGVSLVVINDSSTQQTRSLRGDLFALLSAFFFALYCVVLPLYSRKAVVGRRGVGSQGRQAMAFDSDLFVGLSGLFMTIAGVPVFFLLSSAGLESYVRPSRYVMGLIVGNSFFCEVVPFLLWVRASRMTSGVVMSLASSLMVPMCIAWESLMNGKSFQMSYVVGAALVLIAFFILNSNAESPAAAAVEHDENETENVSGDVDASPR